MVLVSLVLGTCGSTHTLFITYQTTVHIHTIKLSCEFYSNATTPIRERTVIFAASNLTSPFKYIFNVAFLLFLRPSLTAVLLERIQRFESGI